MKDEVSLMPKPKSTKATLLQRAVIDALEKEVESKEDLLAAFKQESADQVAKWEAWVGERLAAQRRRLEADAKKLFGADLDAARKDVQTAAANLVEAEERKDAAVVKQAEQNLPYPPGTILQKMRRQNHWASKDNTHVPTGQKGVQEIWTNKSWHPGGQVHNIPMVGTLVVRLLRKDGTPSTRFEVPHYSRSLLDDPNWEPIKGVTQ